MSTRPADYRVIRSALMGSVSISHKRFIESAVPRFLRIGFIPSCRISPSESLRRASLLLLSEPLSCQGSVPLRDITDGVHVREPSQGPATSPSSGFLSLPTDYATTGFAGLLHPAATSRVVTVQGILPPHSRPGSSPVRAPVSLSSERSPASRLPPSNASTSRPCSVRWCVPQGRGLAFPAVAPLFGFVLPQVLATRRGPGFPGASARDVSGAVFSSA